MFEAIRPVAPPSAVATDDDLDRIEQMFACRLPADYRLFMKTFGPGNLNGYLDILTLDRVIDETIEMREIYTEDGEDPANPTGLFFFDCFDNAFAYFQPADIDRFICIASSGIGDTHYILPGDPPRYFEPPRDGFEVAVAGPTIDDWFDYLDPRTRYQPQAHHIVEGGLVKEDDGRPDGTAYIHTFTPEGYSPLDPRPWIDREVVWGHADDPCVAYSLSYGYDSLPDTTLDLIHDYMARYPLFALLDRIAQHNPSTRFYMQAEHRPEAEFSVSRYEATLRAAGGHHGLTLYIHTPQEHASALFHWLAQEIDALGVEVPHGLRALVSD